MGVRWFRRSDDGRVAALDVLAAAVADANHGGSLYETADALARLLLDHADPDSAWRVLSTMRPRTWLRLDVELRSLRHFFRPHGQWEQITAAAGVNPLALLLCACSGDGRQRQRSVQTPLMHTDQRLLPVLLIRTADWAKQVRDDARQVLPTALEAADADGLLLASGMAIALREWQRGEFVTAAVTGALRTRSDGALDAARMSDDVQVRRLAYHVWLERDDADVNAIVAAAFTERDIICHSVSVDAVVRAAVRDRERDALDQLLAARFARVREKALAGLVELGHPEAGDALLADTSATVRATAQWAMRRAEQDAAERYRAMLASGDDSLVRVAVAGLGECGVTEDALLVARYLGHDRPRVRAEAVRAVRRLGGAPGRVAGMLTDPAPVVVRAVVGSVLGDASVVATEQLWALLAADRPDHVRRAAFRLLITRDTWTRIEADLRLVGDPDERLRAHASMNLTSWLESTASYQMPPDATRERLGRLIAAEGPNIDDRQAHRLRWYLGI